MVPPAFALPTPVLHGLIAVIQVSLFLSDKSCGFVPHECQIWVNVMLGGGKHKAIADLGNMVAVVLPDVAGRGPAIDTACL